MALIVLTSASGSPGVTTTAVGLSTSWARPVLLLEADPTGGSAVVAGYLQGQMTPRDALLDLSLANRPGELADALAVASSALPGTQASFVPGTRSRAQSRGLQQLWHPLAGVLRDLEATGQDVIVDAGRLGLQGSPWPLLLAADLCLLVVRSDLVSLAAARSLSEELRERFETAGGGSSLGALVTGEGRPYPARDIAAVLQLPVIGGIAWDPAGAGVFAHGAAAPRRFETSPYMRSLQATQAALRSSIETARRDLHSEPTRREAAL